MAKLTKKETATIQKAYNEYKVELAKPSDDDINFELITAQNDFLVAVAEHIGKLTNYEYDTEMYNKRFKGREDKELEHSIKLFENYLG